MAKITEPKSSPTMSIVINEELSNVIDEANQIIFVANRTLKYLSSKIDNIEKENVTELITSINQAITNKDIEKIKIKSKHLSEVIRAIELRDDFIREPISEFDSLMLSVTSKYNSSEYRNWIEALDAILLKILEKYNFSREDKGTKYYVAILRKIILFLEEAKKNKVLRSKKEELKKQILNPNSQFYLDIVCELGADPKISEFHAQIKNAAWKAREKSRVRHQQHFNQNYYLEYAYVLAETTHIEMRKRRIIVESQNVNTKNFISKVSSSTTPRITRRKARKRYLKNYLICKKDN